MLPRQAHSHAFMTISYARALINIKNMHICQPLPCVFTHGGKQLPGRNLRINNQSQIAAYLRETRQRTKGRQTSLADRFKLQLKHQHVLLDIQRSCNLRMQGTQIAQGVTSKLYRRTLAWVETVFLCRNKAERFKVTCGPQH